MKSTGSVRERTHGAPPFDPPLPRYVDPIWHRTAAGDLEDFARNSRGLHVPIAALTVREQCLAPSWRAFCEAVDFEKLDGAAP